MEQINLEERTERHPQLAGRKLPAVYVSIVEALLAASPRYVGAGSFCRVWKVERWTHSPSPARGQPVAIKVCSAGFKEELSAEQRRIQQAKLMRHWYRELNAHLLLQDQPRVIRAYHAFQGQMLVPPVPAKGEKEEDAATREPKLMQVVGIVEEYANQTSLCNFSWLALRSKLGPCMRHLWRLEHLASECAALMEQARRCRRGVHLPSAPGALPLLKLGDLNGMQWLKLTQDGHHWMGTVGFMPDRVRKLYLGQRFAAPNVGELNYDTYQMGKLLLRQMLELAGIYVSYVKKDDDLQAEETEVKGSAISMLHQAAPEGEPDKELWAFGVVIGLGMAWDQPYTGPEDQLRLLPGQAADALRDWAAICKAWRAAGSAAFWASPANVDAMARLYLRLTELCRLPPLDEPLEPGVHTQTDEYLDTALDSFFLSGTQPQQRLGLVKAQVRVLLAERRAAAERAAAEARHLAAQQEAERQRVLAQRKRDKPSLRSTAWETKVAQRAEAEDAFLDASTEEAGPSKKRLGGENAGATRQLRKRKAGDAAGAAGAAAAAAAKKPRAAAAGNAAAAAAPAADEAAGAAAGSQGNLLVLSSKLRLKDIWGAGVKPAADAPQVLGPQHAVAQMLADTVRAAAAAAAYAGGGGAAAGGELALRLGSGCPLRFGLTSRRSVQFSRAEFLALAGNKAASGRWNAFVDAALASWGQRGKEASRAERLRLLRPLLAPGGGAGR
ncbi:hypothetical protein ABPG75_006607 [Micractinium tetrahymenae]